MFKREESSLAEFNKWAPKYNTGFWQIYFTSAFKRILKLSKSYISPSCKILDIGCGTGEFCFLLSKNISEGEIIGFDISPEMIAIANKKRMTTGNDKISFIKGHVTKLTFANDFYDIIYCINAFHHFPHHMEALKEINRVLKPNGVFILLDLINDTVLRKTWIKIMKFLFQEHDVEFHTKQELVEIFSDTGLKTLKIETFLFFTAIIISRKLHQCHLS